MDNNTKGVLIGGAWALTVMAGFYGGAIFSYLITKPSKTHEPKPITEIIDEPTIPITNDPRDSEIKKDLDTRIWMLRDFYEISHHDPKMNFTHCERFMNRKKHTHESLSLGSDFEFIDYQCDGIVEIILDMKGDYQGILRRSWIEELAKEDKETAKILENRFLEADKRLARYKTKFKDLITKTEKEWKEKYLID